MKLRIATLNIKNFPDMAPAKVDADARRVGTFNPDIALFQEIGDLSDWVSLQEVFGEKITRATIDGDRDTKIREKRETQIGWGSGWTLVRPDVAQFLHDGIPNNRFPSRYVREAILKHPELPVEVAVLCVHPGQRAYPGALSARRAEREKRWREGFQRLILMVREHIQANRIVIVGGDWNWPAKSLASEFIPKLGGGFIKVLGNPNGIDSVWVRVPLGYRMASTQFKPINVNSDHHLFTGEIDIKPPETTPPPEEVPVPSQLESQNGYIANDRSRIRDFPVKGTKLVLHARFGAPGELLARFAARFNESVEPLDKGQRDDWSYAERTVKGSSTDLSNHASGTAIDLNATQHPLVARNTFTPIQVRAIRELLVEFEGTIRWGGDYTKRKDDMHFEISASPERCQEVWTRLQALDAKPPMPGPRKRAAFLIRLAAKLVTRPEVKRLILAAARAVETGKVT